MNNELWEVIHQIYQTLLLPGSDETREGQFLQILDQIQVVIPFKSADILEYDLDQGEALILAKWGEESLHLLTAQRFPIGDPAAYRNTLQGSNLKSLAGDAWLPADYRESQPDQKPFTWTVAHLVARGTILGSLVLGMDPDLVLSPDQVGFLMAAADLLCVALRGIGLTNRTIERTNELETFVQVSTSLRKARMRYEMYPILTSTVTSALHADVGALFILEEGVLTAKAAIGAEGLTGMRYQAGEGMVWQILREGAPTYLPVSPEILPGREAPPWMDLLGAVSTIALIPMTAADQTIGMLFLARLGPEPFTVSEKRELSAVAELGGNAFHRAALMETLEQRVQDRTRALATLYQIAASGNASLTIAEFLEHALNECMDTFQCTHGMIHLLDPETSKLHLAVQRGWPESQLSKSVDWFEEDDFWEWIHEQKEPLWILDPGRDPRSGGYRLIQEGGAYLGAPILSHSQVVGVLSLMGQNVINFTRDDFTLATTIADQVGILLESYRLRKLDEENAVIEERQRLARDLHDSVTQSLYSLVFLSESWRRSIQNGKLEEAHLWPEELEEIAHQALKEMRLLLYELRPVDLDELRLAEALHQRLISVEERSNIHTEIIVTGEDLLPHSLTHELYQIAHEALNNILKHAEASQVTVRLAYTPTSVTLVVTDNGKGFDPASIERMGGLGLLGMQERIRNLSGKLKITSSPGAGTQILAFVSW
jgi:nitrate/nitrite-specific signal transduction histidine kinase